MTDERLIVQLSSIEVAQLVALVDQFAHLVDRPEPGDAGLERLAPDAYPDDPEAADEFHRLTRDDLLTRRSQDAQTVLHTLDPDGDLPPLDELDDAAAALPRTIELEPEQSGAWLRTLAALRLVLASRLGIVDEADTASDDPRFVLYEWTGMILDALVRALERD